MSRERYAVGSGLGQWAVAGASGRQARRVLGWGGRRWGRWGFLRRTREGLQSVGRGAVPGAVLVWPVRPPTPKR